MTYRQAMTPPVLMRHAHSGMQPTGFRMRDIQVNPGTTVVRVPEPTYDDPDIVIPCPYCMDEGAKAERQRLRDEFAQWTNRLMRRDWVESLLAEPEEDET